MNKKESQAENWWRDSSYHSANKDVKSEDVGGDNREGEKLEEERN